MIESLTKEQINKFSEYVDRYLLRFNQSNRRPKMANKAVFHGECVLSKVSAKPSGLVKVKIKGDSHIIANSEMTGNHHLENEVETEVFCADKSRHDSITLEPGIWKINRTNEYDFLADEVRKVAD